MSKEKTTLLIVIFLIIAFEVVLVYIAPEFSLILLGAGLFTTQMSHDSVNNPAINDATNLEVTGPVIIQTDSGGAVQSITFTLVLAAGGVSLDTTKFTYVASSATRSYVFSNADVEMTWYSGGSKVGGRGVKTFLERGDVLEVTVSYPYTNVVTANNPFTIRVEPPIGASLSINRHAPLSLSPNRVYEVY